MSMLGPAIFVMNPSDVLWDHAQAVEFCIRIEEICPRFGCHVALTGGLLYKTGLRKDCDVVFYRIRQAPKIDGDGLFKELSRKMGLVRGKGFGFLVKAFYQGKSVDCMFPEELGGYYPVEDKKDD